MCLSLLGGRVAIITGAASDIGRATAIAMARKGATVVVADRDHGGAARVAGEIADVGNTALAMTVDVSVELQVKDMINETVAAFGRIEILDNNAADLSLLAEDGDLLETDSDVWRRTFEANQQSVMVACKYALPHLMATGREAIINITSVDGELGDDTRFAYSMSKAAINLLTLSIASTYGKRGVRCNAIVPGLVMGHGAAQRNRRSQNDLGIQHSPRPHRRAGGNRPRGGVPRQRRGILR